MAGPMVKTRDRAVITPARRWFGTTGWSGILLVMTGKLPMDLILDEYPPPLPLHPDDGVEGAEPADDRPLGDTFLRVNPNHRNPGLAQHLFAWSAGRLEPAAPTEGSEKSKIFP